MTKVSRRNFLSAATTGIVGLGITGKAGAVSAQSGDAALKIIKYNNFGNTGLKVSDVSCGAISLFEPNVLRYAYDLGVNYFDTAESYLRTKSETFIGQALKDVRDKVVIVTKHGYSERDKIARENIIQRVEASLKRMQTDYVDIALVHGVNDVKFLDNEELQEAYASLKKDGKIRFTGFSTHNASLTLKQAINSDFTQVVLAIYNHDEGKEIEPLLSAVRNKGIATVAMKVFAGGKHGNLQQFISPQVSYPQAAIRWVLSNKDIDCCIVTMSSYAHVEEYIAASGQPLQRSDLQLLAEYRKTTSHLYCRVSCSSCLSACPHHVAVNDILRYRMYFEDYKQEKNAMSCYSQLSDDKKPLPCLDCPGYCISSCPYGLQVKQRLIEAHDMLSA